MFYYTYLIGWSKLNTYYYGRRTNNKVSPEEDLWIFYFTSSKYVKDFVVKNGDPDIIQIRRKFINLNDCIQWECKVLRRLGIPKNIKFLNKSISTSKMDTTGLCNAVDIHGNKLGLVSLKDSRWQSGEIIAESKGRRYSDEVNATKASCKGQVAVKDKDGKCFRVSKDDPRWLSGDLVSVNTGRKLSESLCKKISERKKGKRIIKDILTDEIFEVSCDDPLISEGRYIAFDKGKVMAKDIKTGIIFKTTKDDPRWETNEIIHPHKNQKTIVNKITGEKRRVSKDDPICLLDEWENTGGTKKGIKQEKIYCIYCGREIGKGNYNRFHGDKCKLKE